MVTPERSVWIFMGDRAHWPSGVFSSREAAVQWITERHLTGMITEYPVDVGVYDYFSPVASIGADPWARGATTLRDLRFQKTLELKQCVPIAVVGATAQFVGLPGFAQGPIELPPRVYVGLR